MDNTDNLIKEQFDKLPLDVKEAINRVPWKERISGIAEREGLSPDMATALETETMLLLYGLTQPADYPANISREAQLGEESAERITKEVYDEIVSDIEKQLEMLDATSNLHAGAVSETKGPEPKQEPAEPAVDIVIEKQVEPAPSVPERAPQILPETMPGQKPHDVAHIEAKKEPLVQTPAYTAPPAPTGPNKTPDEGPKRPDLELPKSDYPTGQDPYREPLE